MTGWMGCGCFVGGWNVAMMGGWQEGWAEMCDDVWVGVYLND